MKKSLLILLFALGVSYWGWGQTYHDLSSGSFSQNWTNTGLITTNDVWTGVPSIIGYRGDDITTTTGVDPQTLLGEGIITVDVNANQTAPNTYATGGVTEFEIIDPVVALSGSGTADAPNIIFFINTTSVSNIQIQYNLRDIDGSVDNAIQQVALQYRIGTSGNFTNIPAGYVADASSGPSLATLVTPVSVTLPSAGENQSQIQLRIMTTNAVGNDEWIGIDDISISGTTSAIGPTKLAITAINGGNTPSANTPFNLVVQSQDASNVPANVTANTDFSLSLATGNGSLGGTLTGTIFAGSSTATVTGVTYNTVETGVSITATRTSGDVLSPGTSALFAVFAAADHLAFVNVPSYGLIATNLNTFTVEARRSDNTVDANYVSNISVSKATGSGNLTGTTVKTPVSGISTFNDLQFDGVDTYTLNATSGAITSATSGNIEIVGAILAYRSIVSGNWNNKDTWEGYTGTQWIPSFDWPVSPTKDVTVRTGHSVIVPTSYNLGTAKNLTVESGATLYANASSGSCFVYVYGDIQNDGTIGGATDVIGFDIEGTSCQLNGNGSFIAARIAKFTTANLITNFTINQNVKLTYSSASSAALRNGQSASTTFNIVLGAGKQLTVPNAKIDLAGCTLTLKSDATGTASLIDNGTISGQTGTNVTVERSFSGNDPDYHLVSSPISNATANVFLGMYLMSFNPLPSAPYGIGNDWGYTDIIDPATALNIMEGYALYSTAVSNNVSFIGNLNTGAHSHTFDFNSNNPYGWNLLGNPYPSSIDWDLVIIPTEMNGEVHYIEAATGADISYVLGGGGGGRFVPAMQGFFVSAINPGSLQLTNTVRSHGGAGSYYKNKINDLLVLEVAGNGYTNETRIYFNSEATNEHDRLFDSYKIITSSNPQLPQIYSITTTGVKLGINGLPETPSVPAGFICGIPGEYTISAIETSEFGNVVLEDLLTGVKTDLLKGSYTFDYGLNELENRFIVHFTPLTVPENTDNISSIYSRGTDVYVVVKENTTGSIVIYNVMGQEVASSAIYGTTNKLTLNKSAYYVVKVLSNESVVTKKVFVK